MNIVLLGPPGAGKGTQAIQLAKELNLPHISTGDLLRQNVAGNTPLGKQAKDYMDKGALVPDELVSQMLSQRLGQTDTKKGFILDGYPRNLNQAIALDKVLKENNIGIDFVFYLETSEAVVVQRLSGRLVCKSCGANFHITNMPPKVNGACDNCGGSLYQRSDDKEETIKKRLEVYNKEVSVLIKYYKDKQKLEALSSDGEAKIVLDKILSLVKERNDSLKV